jgi:hypothetical protein
MVPRRRIGSLFFRFGSDVRHGHYFRGINNVFHATHLPPSPMINMNASKNGYQPILNIGPWFKVFK